jgi:serine/threonine protein kinase
MTENGPKIPYRKDKDQLNMATQVEEKPYLDKLIRLGKKGEGVYGIVYSACELNDTHSTLVVKRNIIDNTGDFICSLRELDILVRLNGHPHIVSTNSISFGNPFCDGKGSVLSPISNKGYKDDKIHFIFEEAHEDCNSYFAKASWSALKRCMVHLLLAIEYCHGKGIIHRDLKPSNLLIFNPKDPTLKVCDFGLSKPTTYQGIQTPSVVTSWYRAPEILLEEEYDTKVDLWSVGCIFYEMVTKLPLLHGSPDRPGTIINHLSRLFPRLIPTKNQTKEAKIIPSSRRPKTWQARLMRKARVDEMAAQGWNMELFIDLLNHLLCRADERYDATEALNHEFFSDYIDYIADVRRNYPPTPDAEPVIKIIKDKRRDMACKIAKKIFTDRKKYSWYSHRILFQAISLFDRYLTSDVEKPALDTKMVRLAFVTCLYIAVKYFLTLSTLIPFASLYGEISEEEKKWAEEFEMFLVEKVNYYTIYQPTLYEAADAFGEILDDNHVRDLLDIYIEAKVKHRNSDQISDLNGLQPTQVYRYYRGYLD